MWQGVITQQASSWQAKVVCIPNQLHPTTNKSNGMANTCLQKAGKGVCRQAGKVAVAGRHSARGRGGVGNCRTWQHTAAMAWGQAGWAGMAGMHARQVPRHAGSRHRQARCGTMCRQGKVWRVCVGRQEGRRPQASPQPVPKVKVWGKAGKIIQPTK